MRTAHHLAASLTLAASAAAFVAAAPHDASAAGYPKASALTVTAGTPFSVDGDLAAGGVIPLTWASKSSIACFPATENDNFAGNHVLFNFSLPKHSVAKITATPVDATTDLSVYALQVGTSETKTPPVIASATTCEAGYDAKNDSNPGVAESVTVNATTNAYKVVVGVAGAKGVTTGKFKLSIELTSAQTVESAVLVPTPLTLTNGAVEVTGSLDKGGIIDLDWASNSSVACFPATENANFAGNHVLYTVALPKQTVLTATVTPKSSSTDVSVYLYQSSATSPSPVPPNVTSVTSCEAGYDAKHDSNPGVAETAKINSTTNAYNVLVGVAGAKGVTSGEFTLKLEAKPR